MIRKFLTVIFFLITVCVFSQERPVGKFLKDRIKVGEPVQYTLSFRHHIEQDIIFPDSTYPYTPFEFIEKRYFKTKSDSIYSYDSAVYTLSTFEIDSILHLAMPVFLIENEDTTKLFALPDSILLIPSLTRLPDSVKFMETSSYVSVDREFNYSYLFIGLSLFFLVAILLILIFGKRVIREIKIKRLRKKHLKFLISFKEINARINGENFEENLLKLYSLWKEYMQQLTAKPFTSYSSKEINRIINEQPLKESLNKIDKGIYAHRFPDNMGEISGTILDVAQRHFNEIIKEQTTGKTKHVSNDSISTSKKRSSLSEIALEKGLNKKG